MGVIWFWEKYAIIFLTNQFCGAIIHRFITVFTIARRRSLSWAKGYPSTVPPPPPPPGRVSIRSVLIAFSIYASVFRAVSFLRGFPPKPCILSSHACPMSCQPHSSWFGLPNNTWGWVQIMKLLTVQLSLLSCYFIYLWLKYFFQNYFLNQH
jgi:hypothetical protein